MRIMCFATKGDTYLEGERIRRLLKPLSPEAYSFDHGRKFRSAVGLVRTVLARRPNLIVMEGTGLAGGATLLMIDAVLGIPFVVSSGDAVGPYLRLHSRLAGLLGSIYERLLCRRCAGYIGWTPYLVGRALTFGAARGVTAAGWSDRKPSPGAREAVRRRLGIPHATLLFGIVGSLNWRQQRGYAYGAELVRAVRMVDRADIAVCVVGDGPGREHLEEIAGDDCGGRVTFTGRVPTSDVADYLAAFDVASLPQSVDQVGAFRFTTKLSEYIAAGVPIVTSQIPAAYDLDGSCFWRLPGDTPWSSTYVKALARLMETLDPPAVAARRASVARASKAPFDEATQQRRVCDLVGDILERRADRM